MLEDKIYGMMKKFAIETGGRIIMEYRGKVRNKGKKSDIKSVAGTAKTVIDEMIQELFLAQLYKIAPDVRINVEENIAVIESAKKEVVLAIDNGGGNLNTIAVEFKEGMTAFDLLKEGAEKLTLPLKTKNYDIGVFIEAIGDKKNGQDGKYWLYYVNGEAPMVAADKMEIKAGDKVEFKFEKSLL